VSGREPFAGSAVVIRHCSAVPHKVIASWWRPRSSRVSPAAIRNWDWTKSSSVISEPSLHPKIHSDEKDSGAAHRYRYRTAHGPDDDASPCGVFCGAYIDYRNSGVAPGLDVGSVAPACILITGRLILRASVCVSGGQRPACRRCPRTYRGSC
jgi:hypothetical protein